MKINRIINAMIIHTVKIVKYKAAANIKLLVLYNERLIAVSCITNIHRL